MLVQSEASSQLGAHTRRGSVSGHESVPMVTTGTASPQRASCPSPVQSSSSPQVFVHAPLAQMPSQSLVESQPCSQLVLLPLPTLLLVLRAPQPALSTNKPRIAQDFTVVMLVLPKDSRIQCRRCSAQSSK